MSRPKIAILGADISAFHLFNTLYRSDDRYDVMCFFELHHPKNYDPIPYLTFYPMNLSGDLYQGINIYHSFPYKQAYPSRINSLDQVVFAPSAVYSPQYLYSAAEFIAMDTSIVTHSLEKTRLPPPKALVSFFSSTQFDIPILLKMLQMYKDKGINPLIAMQAPIYPFQSKDSDVNFFFYLENLDNFEAHKYYFKNRHEIEMIKSILKNGYRICFIYDFAKFSTEATRRDEFNMIVFVGLNSLPCFFESHRVVYACDDFTFGDEITTSPNFILCQQANIILYAHLGPPNSSEKIKSKLKELNLSNLLNFVCIPVNYKAKNSNNYSGKVALLVDDSYPTQMCNSYRSISKFLATSLNMIPFDDTASKSTEIVDSEEIYGVLSDKNWPAIILPESSVGVTNINENVLPKYKNYDVIVSSSSNPCDLKPPSPIQVIQFDFELNLEILKPEIFQFTPGDLVK